MSCLGQGLPEISRFKMTLEKVIGDSSVRPAYSRGPRKRQEMRNGGLGRKGINNKMVNGRETKGQKRQHAWGNKKSELNEEIDLQELALTYRIRCLMTTLIPFREGTR